MQLTNILLLFRYFHPDSSKLHLYCNPFSFFLCLLMLSFTERSGSYSSTSPKKYDHLNESDVEIVEQFDELNLEETCVLVEGGRLHIPQGSVKRKSYKVPFPSPPSSRVIFGISCFLFIWFLLVWLWWDGCFIANLRL